MERIPDQARVADGDVWRQAGVKRPLPGAGIESSARLEAYNLTRRVNTAIGASSAIDHDKRASDLV
jgi:hypothetical protein